MRARTCVYIHEFVNVFVLDGLHAHVFYDPRCKSTSKNISGNLLGLCVGIAMWRTGIFFF